MGGTPIISRSVHELWNILYITHTQVNVFIVSRSLKTKKKVSRVTKILDLHNDLEVSQVTKTKDPLDVRRY